MDLPHILRSDCSQLDHSRDYHIHVAWIVVWQRREEFILVDEVPAEIQKIVIFAFDYNDFEISKQASPVEWVRVLFAFFEMRVGFLYFIELNEIDLSL